MRQVIAVGLLLAGAPAWAQAPAARLGAPALPAPAVVRAAGADFWDDAPQPSARLGALSSADIGKGPAEADDAERFNWGAPRKGATLTGRDKESDRDRERDRGRTPAETASRTRRGEDREARGARLRDPDAKLMNYNRDDDRDRRPIGSWLDENTRDLRAEVREWGEKDQDRLQWESDRVFKDFVSPISNPMLAEDPRALTELRPLFIYQTIPKKQYLYQGGNTEFFGLQARLAFTERFSVVLNRLGGNIFNPGDTSPLDSEMGLSEIWIAPKFAFWRDADTHTIGTAGVIFQMPFGGSSVYQDTGSLSLVPYFSYGTRLWKTQAGQFTMQNTVGYALSRSDLRSDYLYDTVQLSLDLLDGHRFFPVVELSWFHYTTDGTERPGLAFEGRDLANVGSPVSGRNFLSIAPGFRFNLTPSMQFGLSAEFQLLGTKDLHEFRLGVDFIWRY